MRSKIGLGFDSRQLHQEEPPITGGSPASGSHRRDRVTDASENRTSVGKAVSEAAKSGGGSLAVLTTRSELKPANQGIAKALANAIARVTPPVDPVPAP